MSRVVLLLPMPVPYWLCDCRVPVLVSAPVSDIVLTLSKDCAGWDTIIILFSLNKVVQLELSGTLK